MKITFFWDFLFFFHGFSTHFTTIISNTSTLNNEKQFNQGNSKSVDIDIAGCKKSSFLHFKCYNLAIYVVNFLEFFSTHYFNSLKQDPMVGTQEKEI
jgi:hypothetical protein